MNFDVFISYSSSDKGVADAACETLERQGVGCWIAPRNIVPGQEWSEAIIDGLNACRILALIFSARSNESPQVLREVERAVNKRMSLIPFRVENVPLSKAMEYFISVPHWLEAYDPPMEPHLEKLAETTLRLLGIDAGTAMPSAAPAPAIEILSPAAPKRDDASPHLPAEVTAFIGREKEIQEIGDLLEGGARLVTIAGAGGIGKTRIALKVAANRADRYPGGVWWVDLSNLRDSIEVPLSIASVLGVKEEPDREMKRTLADRFKNDPTLLVLDNFEQVIESAPFLSEMIRLCPLLSLLLTSRTVLNLSSEHEYSLSTMEAEEAIRLFVSRAQQAKSSFSLDEKSRIAARSLCEKLDLLPLSIELAAAQTRMLSIPQIEKQLAQRFKALVSGFSDVNQRQRTLRATLDWSYDLLSEEDRKLYARLSVFVGGFALDAGEAVSEIEDAYSGILRLRDQSFLRIVETEGSPRFGMLETLREYGFEKLREFGEEEEARSRHARYFADFAKEHGPIIRDSEDGEALRLLTDEIGNLRAAWDRLSESRLANEVAEMSLALESFWELKGFFREGRSAFQRCLESLTELTDPSTAIRLGNAASWFSYLLADYPKASEEAHQALEMSRAEDDFDGECNALNNLALIAQAQGKMPEAKEFFSQSLEIARALGDERKQASRLSNLGSLSARMGDADGALNSLEEARSLFFRVHDSLGAAIALCNLSDLALQKSEWENAETLSEESLKLFQEKSDAQGIALSLTNLSLATARQGRHESALDYSFQALDICAEIEARWLAVILLDLIGEILSIRDKAREAFFCLSASSAQREALGSPRSEEEGRALEAIESELAVKLGDAAVRMIRRQVRNLSLESIIDQTHRYKETLVD